MNKEKMLEKHELSELDYRNLVRYEQVRRSGVINMFEYMGLMEKRNLNGGKKLTHWIREGNNYEEFLGTLKNGN